MALQLFEQKIQVPRGDFLHVGQMKPVGLRQFGKNRELLFVWFGVVAVNRWQPLHSPRACTPRSAGDSACAPAVRSAPASLPNPGSPWSPEGQSRSRPAPSAFASAPARGGSA